jgi:hypothetical protein
MDKFKSGFFGKEEGSYVITDDELISSYQYYLLGKKSSRLSRSEWNRKGSGFSARRGCFRSPRKRRKVFEMAYLYRIRR